MPIKRPERKPQRRGWNDDALRWKAVLDRDVRADGAFVYSVRTTGIFCRPTCPSRRPKRDYVRFFRSSGEAEKAGFRACKRCCPTGEALPERHAAAVAAACRTLESSEQAPGLKALADAAGMSVYYFHRIFKTMTGLTPKSYAIAHRADFARRELSLRGSVTEAIYASGFQSGSRFYASSSRMLGMKPGRYRDKGSGEKIQFAAGKCSLGSIVVAATRAGVCAVFLGDEPRALVRNLRDRFAGAELIGGDREFEKLVAAVIGVIDSDQRSAALPLDIRGTVFQQRVWKALQRIPRGETATYAEIAQSAGMPGAARAVGRACGDNPVAVLIPCHRVVRRDGGLSGYRWGIARKKDLLARESTSPKEP